MLELFSTGFLSVWLNMAGTQGSKQSNVESIGWLGTPAFVLPVPPEPTAAIKLQQYLNELSRKGSVASSQGVWIQSGPFLLSSNQGTVPLPAASLTKVATSLASLSTWGPSHRFDTLFSATGPIKNGVLEGDLVVTGGGDPLFIWEEAIAVGNALNRLGIKRVAGDLVIKGNFYMNYNSNPATAGLLLKQVLNSSIWSRDASYRYYFSMPKGTPKPLLEIAGTVKVDPVQSPAKVVNCHHRKFKGSGGREEENFSIFTFDGTLRSAMFSHVTNFLHSILHKIIFFCEHELTLSEFPLGNWGQGGEQQEILLLRHRSLTLAQILKQMNIYSNNNMAQMLADLLGGAPVVQKLAAEAAGVPQSEIHLINGSGLGVNNRISPRAVCAMLQAIQGKLKPLGLTIGDLFLVSGRDRRGTIVHRKIPEATVIKTGTLRDVSALAGVMPTRDRGLVWFAIINRGNNLLGLRAEQDRFLQILNQHWGATLQPPKVVLPTSASSTQDSRLGADVRNQILFGG